jgi:hypothetical protein
MDLPTITPGQVGQYLGGEPEVVARFPEGTVKFDRFNQANRAGTR